MARKPSIAIVGPGRLGTALARAMHYAGYPVREIVSSNSQKSRQAAGKSAKRLHARSLTIQQARLDADVVWLCVPDRKIRAVADKLAARAEWANKICFHSSGALGSDQLETLRRQGAAVAAVHPLMTFIADADTPLVGVPFAMEGDPRAVRVARTMVKRLGGEPFAVAADRKPTYHAFGAFVSPLLIALLVTAEDVGLAAGLDRRSVRRRIAPILQRTLKNYLQRGPAKAFTGPLARGDVETVLSHLKATKNIPQARDVYQALARAALSRLPVCRKLELEKTLSAGKMIRERH